MTKAVEKAAREAYERVFNRFGYSAGSSVDEIMKLTGTTPPKCLVIEAYQEGIVAHDHGSINPTLEGLGRRCFGNQALSEVGHLQRITGIKIPKEIALVGYNHYATKQDFSCFTQVHEITGVKALIEPDLAQRLYNIFRNVDTRGCTFRRGDDYTDLDILVGALSVPWGLPNKSVHEEYEVLTDMVLKDNGHGMDYAYGMAVLISATNVQPSEEQVQAVQRACLENQEYALYDRLRKQTNISLPEAELTEHLKQLAEDGCLHGLGECRETLGLVLDDATTQRALSQIVR